MPERPVEISFRTAHPHAVAAVLEVLGATVQKTPGAAIATFQGKTFFILDEAAPGAEDLPRGIHLKFVTSADEAAKAAGAVAALGIHGSGPVSSDDGIRSTRTIAIGGTVFRLVDRDPSAVTAQGEAPPGTNRHS